MKARKRKRKRERERERETDRGHTEEGVWMDAQEGPPVRRGEQHKQLQPRSIAERGGGPGP